MAAIAALARRYGFKIIEDASHAVGARYRDSVTGDCRWSDITVFSFHPVKIVTSAEGGMALTQDALLAGLPLVRPWRDPQAESAWHLYVVQVAASERRRVFDALRAAGIGVNVHYIPIHTQPDYRRLGFAPGDFPVAEDRSARLLRLSSQIPDESGWGGLRDCAGTTGQMTNDQ